MQQRTGSYTLDALQALVFFGLALALLRAAGSVVTVLLFGTFLASIAYPTYNQLGQRGLPAWAALLVVMIGFVGFLLVMGFIVFEAGTRFANELPIHSRLLHERLGALITQLERAGLERAFTQYVQRLRPGDFEGLALFFAQGLLGLLNTLAISLLWVLFLLPGIDGIRRVVNQHASHHPAVASIPLIAQASIGYFRLRLRLSLLLGVGLTVLFLILGVPYPELWGALAIFLTFIPYVGLFLAVAPTTPVADENAKTEVTAMPPPGYQVPCGR